MRKLRQSLLLLVLLAALPMTAHAQWASKIVEHDWRLKLGENSIGLLQEQIDVGVKYRVTSICLGPCKITTGLRASYIAALVLVPFGVVGVVALTRPGQRQIRMSELIINTAEEGVQHLKSNPPSGAAFELAISNSLTFAGKPDPVGFGMALILREILRCCYEPDGFEQKNGFRLYRYKKIKSPIVR